MRGIQLLSRTSNLSMIIVAFVAVMMYTLIVLVLRITIMTAKQTFVQKLSGSISQISLSFISTHIHINTLISIHSVIT